MGHAQRWASGAPGIQWTQLQQLARGVREDQSTKKNKQPLRSPSRTIKNQLEQASSSRHLRMDEDPVSKMFNFLAPRIPDDGYSPETQ
jgi:hypothetical protein